jgi:hypothetical protein
MHSSAWVPARVNRDEPRFALRIGHLVASQKFLPDRVEAWVSYI